MLFKEQHYGEPIWDAGRREHDGAGRPSIDSGLRARARSMAAPRDFSGCERGSVDVVLPASSRFIDEAVKENGMRIIVPPSKWGTPLICSYWSRKVFDGYDASTIRG